MKKKRPYEKPRIEVIKVEPTSILAGSPGLKVVDGVNSSDGGFPDWSIDNGGEWIDGDATME